MDIGVLKRGAIAALQRQHWHEAQSLAARLIDLAPADPEAHCIAGVAMLEQDRVIEARDAFRQAIALAPGRADFHLYQARACASAQDYNAALAAAAEAERLLPPTAQQASTRSGWCCAVHA